MDFLHLLLYCRLRTTSVSTEWGMGPRRSFLLSAMLLALILAGCSGLAGEDTQSQPMNVNFFGTAANHVHSLISLPNNVLVLATHYGLFRSADGGQHWALVTADPDQGMMTNWLALVRSIANAST